MISLKKSVGGCRYPLWRHSSVTCSLFCLLLLLKKSELSSTRIAKFSLRKKNKTCFSLNADVGTYPIARRKSSFLDLERCLEITEAVIPIILRLLECKWRLSNKPVLIFFPFYSPAQWVPDLTMLLASLKQNQKSSCQKLERLSETWTSLKDVQFASQAWPDGYSEIHCYN